MSQLLLSTVSPSVSLYSGRPATTSREVAKLFGKRHDHICRDIRSLIDNTPESFHAPNFGEMSEPVEIGNGATRQDVTFILYRDGFMLLVMGYTGKKAMAMKIAYIEAFNAMEAALASRLTELDPAPLPLTDAPITPDQQCTLQAIIKGKVEAIPVEERSKGLYPHLWSRFNNHFRIAKYAQLPQCRMSEAVEYLMLMDIRPAKALPPASTPRLVDRPAGPIETRLDELRRELDKFGGAIEDFRLLVQEILRTASPLHMEVYQRLGWHERCGVSIGSLTEILVASSCDSERHAHEAYVEAYRCVAQARALARLSGM